MVTKREEYSDGHQFILRRQYADKLRRTTFLSVAFGSAASIASIILVPIIYTYAQRIQSSLQPDLSECRAEGRQLWNEFRHIESFINNTPKGRLPRQSSSIIGRRLFDPSEWVGGMRRSSEFNRPKAKAIGTFGSNSNSRRSSGSPPSPSPYLFESILPQCCKCGIGEPGSPGPTGPPGVNGIDGRQGVAGLPGADGIPGAPLNEQEWCFDCPQAAQGPKGPLGPKGPNGAPGLPGREGHPGKQGPPGPVGPPGFTGLPGQNGPPGTSGEPGKLIAQPAAKGQSGLAGIDGPPGQPGQEGSPGKTGKQGPMGQKGVNGLPGQPGRNGPKGPPGKAGEAGLDGGCDHCPPPRLADGYEAPAAMTAEKSSSRR